MLFMKHRVNKEEDLSECGLIQLLQLLLRIENPGSANGIYVFT